MAGYCDCTCDRCELTADSSAPATCTTLEEVLVWKLPVQQFETAMREADLLGGASDAGIKATVFAFTDGAWELFLSELGAPLGRRAMEVLIAAHISGTPLESLSDATAIETLLEKSDGSPVALTISDGGSRVCTSSKLCGDVVEAMNACEANVYVVNKVLVPS